jgi:hypothetical protein
LRNFFVDKNPHGCFFKEEQRIAQGSWLFARDEVPRRKGNPGGRKAQQPGKCSKTLLTNGGGWMMRWGKCLALALVLAVAIGAQASAKDAVVFGEITTAKINPNSTTIEVPIYISNSDNLAAIDVPLKFGEPGDGIQLVDVDLEGRAHYFDVKVANIDNDNKTVLIGLLWMAYNADQEELDAGDGRLATMTFEVTDQMMESFTIEATEFDDPHHHLGFIYSEVDAEGNLDIHWDDPAFEPITIPVAPKTPVIPEEWSLDQNYPNPFNASTVISFGLPMDSHVRLDVFNILGQRVTTLKDEFMPAGRHSVNWKDDQIASGVYFYRLQTDEFTQTRKMTLMK